MNSKFNCLVINTVTLCNDETTKTSIFAESPGILALLHSLYNFRYEDKMYLLLIHYIFLYKHSSQIFVVIQ